MKVLIIGGTGFIGSAVTRLFIQNGHSVALFHRNKMAAADGIPGAAEIIGFRKEIVHFRRAFLSFQPDLVIDTIAYTAQDIWSLQVAIRDITNNLLVLSSGDVYKVYDTFLRSLPGADNAPATENSPLRDHLFPYKPERTNKYDDLLFNYDKIVVERMIDRQYFNTCILRLPAVFGAGDKQKRFSEYIQPMLAGQPFIKLDPKKAKWIWTRSYVENAAYGIYLAATKPEASNEVFNLGDIHLSELELINKLKSLTGWKGEIILESSTSESYNFDQHLIMDSSKIRKLLSYNEPVKLEAALERTIQGYIS